MVVWWRAIKKKNIPLCCSKPWHDKTRECRHFLVQKNNGGSQKQRLLLCMRTDLYYRKYKLSVKKINNLNQKPTRQIKHDKTTRCNTRTNVSNIVMKEARIQQILWILLTQNTLFWNLWSCKWRVFWGLPKWNSLTSADSFDSLHVRWEPNCCVAFGNTWI